VREISKIREGAKGSYTILVRLEERLHGGNLYVDTEITLKLTLKEM
jgi:hypothetical protein